MRNLMINKSLVNYLNYKGQVAVEDENHKLTGEKTIEYSTLKKIYAHVSSAVGSSQVDSFGTEINYDKTILLTRDEFEETQINENSVFFLDKKPEFNKDNAPLYDYHVVRIAKTINEVVIAVKKVDN